MTFLKVCHCLTYQYSLSENMLLGDGGSEQNSDSDSVASGHEDPYFSAEEDPEDPRAKILTVEELENHFLEKAPDLSGTWGPVLAFEL
jgi:hypothetical protein